MFFTFGYLLLCVLIDYMVMRDGYNPHLPVDLINPLPDMPILGSSSSAANKDMMSNIWTNGDTITCT